MVAGGYFGLWGRAKQPRHARGDGGELAAVLRAEHDLHAVGGGDVLSDGGGRAGAIGAETDGGGVGDFADKEAHGIPDEGAPEVQVAVGAQVDRDHYAGGVFEAVETGGDLAHVAPSGGV